MLRGGRLRAVLATGDLNFLDASDEERARHYRAFGELLNSLTAPIQIWFQSTRLHATDLPASSEAHKVGERAAAWRTATQDFLTGRLEERPMYRRRVALILQPPVATAPGRVLDVLRRATGRPPPPVADPTRSTEEEQRIQLARQAEDLIDQLAHLGLRAWRLSSSELVTLFADLYGATPAPLWRDRASGPLTCWVEAPTWFRVSDRYYRSFHLLEFPGGELEPGWLAPLAGYSGELQLSLHISPLASDRVIEYLNSRIRDLRASELAGIETGSDDAATGEALPQALALRSTLARNEEKVFRLGAYVATSAPSLPELRLRSEGLQSIFRRLLVRPAPALLRQREAVKTIWPLGQDFLGMERIVHTSGLATLFPWLSADLYQPGGQYWGMNRRTGGLVVCDPFNAEAFPNANITIFGHSGAGKTYAASSIVLSSYAAGVGTIILDPEHEYAGLCHALGGTYVEIAAGSPHAINALDPILQPADEGQDVTGDVLDLIAVMCGRLDELERARLHAILDGLIQGHPARGPVLGDLQRMMSADRRLVRVATILERWVRGALGRFFNRPTNVDLHNPVIGFGVRDLQEELVAPAYFLISEWIWAQLRRVRRSRHLLIDEAGLLFEDPVIRRFLVRLARRIRKYEGSLLIATQNAGDLLSTPEGIVIATNPSILLLGHQRSGEARRLAQVFALTDRQADALQGARRGEFLMLAGPNRVRLEIAPPPWQHELILRSKQTTEPPRRSSA